MHYFNLKTKLKNSNYFLIIALSKFVHFFLFFQEKSKIATKAISIFSKFLIFWTYYAATHLEMVILATYTHFSVFWQNDPSDPLNPW